MQNADHVSFVFVGPHRWTTYAAFNENVFPKDLASIVGSCGLRLALASASTEELGRRLTQARVELLDSLNRRAHELPPRSGGKPDLQYVAYADGTSYIGTFYSILTNTRAFLDIYALLMGKLIGRNLSWSFKRAKVEGQEMSGGTIINWLSRSAPATLTTAPALRSTLIAHVQEWIGDLVRYRDTVSHYADIAGFKHMRVPLLLTALPLTESAVHSAEMPDGTTIEAYAYGLLRHVRAFVCETFALLPGIDLAKVSPEQLFAPRAA